MAWAKIVKVDVRTYDDQEELVSIIVGQLDDKTDYRVFPLAEAVDLLSRIALDIEESDIEDFTAITKVGDKEDIFYLLITALENQL